MGSFFGGATERKTINDLILEKIQEKEAEQAALNDPEYQKKLQQQQQHSPKLPPKVIQVYTEIGKILKHYSNGKLPKAFKIIPSLSNWEEVLWLTKPDEWSPGAVYAATRIFASNFNERMAQRFYNLILMERVQADIEKNGRLNYHLYTALRKAVYKPAAFYKGILLPMASGGQCSIKDATVMASVLQKVSVPANHSAAVLLKLTEMPYSGPTSLFIRVLLNKKYALPHRVIDSLVNHFVGFSNDKRDLPVLWHQSLLVFAQRYKHDITAAQKEELRVLFKNQFHHLITPEIRRELFSGHSRGEAPQGSMRGSVGSSAAME
jgi:essential nuclear protein 1